MRIVERYRSRSSWTRLLLEEEEEEVKDEETDEHFATEKVV
jgi:hypothetical protein